MKTRSTVMRATVPCRPGRDGSSFNQSAGRLVHRISVVGLIGCYPVTEPTVDGLIIGASGRGVGVIRTADVGFLK